MTKVLQPEVLPLPIGSNNIYTAGLAHQNQSIQKQSALISSAHGGRRRTKTKKRKHKRKTHRTYTRTHTRKHTHTHTRNHKKKTRRGGTPIPVPTFPSIYPEVGAGGQTINGNSLAGIQVSVNTTNNAKLDACVGQPASCTGQVLSK